MAHASADEVLGYFDSLSNWGRWGDDDALGTLNFVTPEVTVAAAREIQLGHSVSCAWPITTQHQEGDLFGTPQRFMLNHGQGVADEDRVSHLIAGRASEAWGRASLWASCFMV